MKILDLLAKLGILRVGAKKAVWHSGKDMPAEMLMDDVLDARRDLTTRQDVQELQQSVTGGAAAKRFCTECGESLDPKQKFCTKCGAAV